jgi:hypothetical protein
MSGHWRLYVTAFFLAAGLSTSPASSNALTDLFNPAPKEADAPVRAQDAPAPAREACVSQPGRSTAPGQHWVYHIDGHRKCWFEAKEATVSAKTQIRHHMVRRHAVAPEETETELRNKTVLDARAQVLNAAPADASAPAAYTPEVVDTASVPAREAAVAAPEAPIAAQPTIDPLTPDHAAPRQVNVEMLLAASTDSDAAASSLPSTTPDAPSVGSADSWESTAAWAGTALIALGFIFLVGSLLASPFFSRRETLRETLVRRAWY